MRAKAVFKPRSASYGGPDQQTGPVMTTTTLPETGFLSQASDALRRVLVAQAHEIALGDGEVVFEQGDMGDALFAILEGRLEFSILSRDGRKLALDMMGPGAVFGEIALFDPGPRTATVTAASPARVCRVRNADVLAEIRNDPDLSADMIRLAGQRMRWMSRQLIEQVFLPMPSRLARKLLYLTADPGGGPAELHLSQAELAEFVGATREAVSKTLGMWKRAGVIAATRGGVVIRDRAALQVLADPDLV